MKGTHALETLLVRAIQGGVRAMSWRASLGMGAAVGELALGLGLRREVGLANLAIAFPERTPEARAEILRRHYRHLGQVACEYARLAELSAAPVGEVIAVARGLEHVEAARRLGRGVILLSGHYGTVELLGACVARHHPVDFVEKPLSNPAVDAIHARLIAEAGVGYIPLGAGARRIFHALRQNRCVALLADQDDHEQGVFVPFMGRLSSTPVGPAAIALRHGSPIVMGFITRCQDGRHEIDILPALDLAAAVGPDAARIVTAQHTACLETWVRRHPEMWLWLHRRWKTPPPEEMADAVAAAREPAAALPGRAREA
ncbi:MAG: lysophospholipid acyltransferase family protein [Candidatus Eisenbacteria bacterium]|uniref:Lysophospholipid acyltransferase family protein n=1 Tax=Eiseniibacteriota bacterium TaxID=2212470 RepID=A0A538U684_UNCEI|nr:MAG: lysophospholipid acyltransferase family protein [Candidatus Eisenbacteria bacterium]